jgi:hypothetical protein
MKCLCIRLNAPEEFNRSRCDLSRISEMRHIKRFNNKDNSQELSFRIRFIGRRQIKAVSLRIKLSILRGKKCHLKV